ncbi:MAG TPA: IS1380 family transposase [Methyloceanibacter sp.]|nr:IS1380 family transposase [Methyloceanibacter sp.]
MTEATPFLPGLSPLRRKPLTAAQDAGNLTSNGGLIVLRESALRSGVAAVVADAVPDTRNQLFVVHSYRAMVTARMMAIAAGYEDADDLDALRFDPALMLACEREPESGRGIPSQPTISRLENVVDARTLYRIGSSYIDFFCRSYATPPKAIVLDIDDTDDLVHGGQQLALFNTHAGGYCFQPIHIFEGNSGKPILSLLRPGKRPSGEEVARVLWHVIHRIRRRWSNVGILVRGDGHYCAPAVLDLLRRLRCDYILGLSINPTLDALATPWREQCEMRRKAGRSKVRRFHQLTYQARRWTREEKVIARVEATEMGSDARFIVTNLTGRAKVLYEKVYCARGRMENLIKDMKLYTRSDKTACSRWQANQFRLFLHMGAYWLLHSVRLAAPKRSRWRGATLQTIRTTFVKLGCRIEELKSRIRLSFSAHLPHARDIALLTARLCAQAP